MIIGFIGNFYKNCALITFFLNQSELALLSIYQYLSNMMTKYRTNISTFEIISLHSEPLLKAW